MKIISKYKDYYDFVVGKYGIDPLIIYVRQPRYVDKDGNPKGIMHAHSPIKSNISNKPEWYPVLVCGERYDVFYYDSKIYCNKNELIELLAKLKKHDHSKEDLRNYVRRVEETLKYKFDYNVSKEELGHGKYDWYSTC